MYGYSEDNRVVMSDLIGKLVTGLKIGDGETVMVVEFEGGQSVYECEGDCCSNTWIADIVGVQRLIGHTVLKVEQLDVPEVEDGRTRQEYDQFYGVKLITDGGYVDVVYRNSSNGYYGGWMGKCESGLRLGVELTSVTDDFSA